VDKSWIVPVGGFLGAGKTTLILAAAQLLRKQGLKPAAILNDQGEELVDTAYARSRDLDVSEVTGGCFCCRFSDFLDAAGELSRYAPDVIFAEPVGSCTDLSATILQPLKGGFLDRYRLAPLTVLVDPGRAMQTVRDPHIDFLFERQIAEADLVAFSKCDRYTTFPPLAGKETRYLSAFGGPGVAAWLDEILSGTIPVGREILDIDYEEYARAEAALGWLNWSASLDVAPALSPAHLVGPFLDELQQAFAEIVHLKMIDRTASSYIKAAVTGGRDEPAIEGDLAASSENRHELCVNLRAALPAGELQARFREQIVKLPGRRFHERLECFSPAPPRPEHRYEHVVRG
jgi:CobW/HypB/UreG family nucleotide-binding protein